MRIDFQTYSVFRNLTAAGSVADTLTDTDGDGWIYVAIKAPTDSRSRPASGPIGPDSAAVAVIDEQGEFRGYL